MSRSTPRSLEKSDPEHPGRGRRLDRVPAEAPPRRSGCCHYPLRQARQSWLPRDARKLLEVATVSRQYRRRSSRRTRQPAPETAAGQADPIWVDVSGRRMFVVGYTPGGAPYGIFEDEMDAGTDDLDMSESDQPY